MKYEELKPTEMYGISWLVYAILAPIETFDNYVINIEKTVIIYIVVYHFKIYMSSFTQMIRTAMLWNF